MNIIQNNEHVFSVQEPNRQAKGFWIFPYSFVQLIRYLFNFIFNGWFSYRNPDAAVMQRLGRAEQITPVADTAIKVVFLGDLMLTRSGRAPVIGDDLKRVLAAADVIVANLESPLVPSVENIRRGCSLTFKMPDQYLKEIVRVNDRAHWVFSVANNHAFDTSTSSVVDRTGLDQTIRCIQDIDAEHMHVIGVLGESSVATFEVGGHKLGFVGWTELMNREGLHLHKPVCRESDLSPAILGSLKDSHSYLIGFAHGNEEQSYYPLKETRDRWQGYLNHFDAIVGHGPHVLHPAEKVDEKLLFHSIGNFCSSVGPTQTKVGLVPELTLQAGQGRIELSSYTIHLIEQKAAELVDTIQSAEDSSYPEMMQRLRKIWPEGLAEDGIPG